MRRCLEKSAIFRLVSERVRKANIIKPAVLVSEIVDDWLLFSLSSSRWQIGCSPSLDRETTPTSPAMSIFSFEPKWHSACRQQEPESRSRVHQPLHSCLFSNLFPPRRKTENGNPSFRRNDRHAGSPGRCALALCACIMGCGHCWRSSGT